MPNQEVVINRMKSYRQVSDKQHERESERGGRERKREWEGERKRERKREREEEGEREREEERERVGGRERSSKPTSLLFTVVNASGNHKPHHMYICTLGRCMLS